jgi:glycerophosphoryl diester phosphodiesterase
VKGTERPEAVAHRGLSAYTYEATLGAYKLAVERGVLSLETDVHLTKDRQLVVMHDSNLQRTTGVDEAVADVTLLEATALVADKDPAWRGREPVRPKDFLPEDDNVPSLESLFELVAKRGAHLKVELKTSDAEIGEVLLDTVERFADRLPRSNLTVFAWTSKQLSQVSSREEARFGAREMGYTRLASAGTAPGFWAASARKKLIDESQRTKQNLAVENVAGLSTEFFRDAHAAGVQVWVWTVNDEKRMRALIEMGADGIISNFADRVGRA